MNCSADTEYSEPLTAVPEKATGTVTGDASDDKSTPLTYRSSVTEPVESASTGFAKESVGVDSSLSSEQAPNNSGAASNANKNFLITKVLINKGLFNSYFEPSRKASYSSSSLAICAQSSFPRNTPSGIMYFVK